MHNFENVIRERARIIAKNAGMDPNLAVHTLRGITCTGTILAGANGQTNAVPILDENTPGAVAGDSFRLRGLGERFWTLVAMVTNAIAGVDAEWGIRNFYQDNNGIDRISFAADSSLSDRGQNASFMSLEAMKSGLSIFPWQQMPAFGPNSITDVAVFNTSGADLTDVQAQFWIMPVKKDYQAPGYEYFESPCPHRKAIKNKYGSYMPTPLTVVRVDAGGAPPPQRPAN